MPRPFPLEALISILENSAVESFRRVSQVKKWLVQHEGDRKLLKRAANHRGHQLRTVPWYLARLRPPVALIEGILQLAPNTVKSKCRDGYLPLTLHAACHKKASYGIIKLLLDAYPKAAKVLNCKKEFPLHLALKLEAPSAVIKILLEACPKGPYKLNKNRISALHMACKRRSTDVFLTKQHYDRTVVVQKDINQLYRGKENNDLH
jgi:hypothetical protein